MKDYTFNVKRRWRAIPGHPDYQASDDGLIRSLKRATPHIMSPAVPSCGYPTFIASTPEGPRAVLVHRAVWEAFNGPIPDHLVINHKGARPDHPDGNRGRSDNRLENLELVTRSENSQHAWKNGLFPQRSPNNPLDFVGVTYAKRKDKWQAQAAVGGKQMWLGYFDTRTEAALAYDEFITINNLDRPLNFPMGVVA